MKAEEQKKLNNLYRRYQGYDNDGTAYVYDVSFSTLSGEQQVKARKHTGFEKFRSHIEELMGEFDDVCSITVTDYNGTSPRAKTLNPPMTISLLDVKGVEHTPDETVSAPPSAGTDILQGLGALFDGKDFAGLGNLAPVAKLIDDRHVIDRLREKQDEHVREITELKRQNSEWQQKYETLNGRFERLQDDADDMEDELNGYRERERKQDRWASMLGLAGASMAKNFLRQNPKFLSAIIPPDQLAGLLSEDDTLPPAEPQAALTDEEQNRLDDATTVFDWLQTLEPPVFAKIITVIAAMRQRADCADRLLTFLQGNRNMTVAG